MIIKVKCVSCKHKMEVEPSFEMPFCPKCHSPMTAYGASLKEG